MPSLLFYALLFVGFLASLYFIYFLLSFVRTKLMQHNIDKAFSKTGRLMQKQLPTVSAVPNVQITPGFILSSIVLLMLITIVVIDVAELSLLTLGIIYLGLALLCWHITNNIRDKHKAKISRNLPSALELMARTIRTGSTNEDALKKVGQHYQNQIGQVFRQMSVELQLGKPFKSVINNANDRMRHPDFSAFCSLLIMQHEIGGNLVKMLTELADSMRDLGLLQKKIDTHGAMEKASAAIATFVPVGLIILLYIVNKNFIMPLFVEPEGRLILAIILLIIITGRVVMGRLSRIEV